MTEKRFSPGYHWYTWTVIALGAITVLVAAFAAVMNPTPVRWQIVLAVLLVHGLLRFFVELRLPGDLYKGGIETAPTFVAEGLAVLVLPWQYAVLASAIVCGIDAYRHQSEPRDARLLMILTSPFTTGLAAVTLNWVNVTGSVAYAWPGVLVTAVTLALYCCTLDEGLIWHWYALKSAERGDLSYRQRLTNVWEYWRITIAYYPHFVGIALLLAYSIERGLWPVFLIVLTTVVTIFWGIALLPHTLARLIRELKEVADLIEARDAYTRGHVDRVAMWAGLIALKQGQSWWRVLGVILVGTLHDIGKITVPDSVLLKPGPLTDEEFLIIQTHVCDDFTPETWLFDLVLVLLGSPDLTVRVLSGRHYGPIRSQIMNWLLRHGRPWVQAKGQRWRRHLILIIAQATVDLVGLVLLYFRALWERRFHHEKLDVDFADRRGYPFRQAGDEVRTVSRILSVADIFDACTSHRPYHLKGPMSPKDAAGVLGKGKGKELIPEFVDLFLDLVRKGEIVVDDPDPGLNAVFDRYTLTTVPDQAPTLLGLAALLTLLGAWLLNEAAAPGWTTVMLGLIAGTQLLSFVRLRLLEWQLTYVLERLRAAVAARATTTLSPPAEPNGSTDGGLTNYTGPHMRAGSTFQGSLCSSAGAESAASAVPDPSDHANSKQRNQDQVRIPGLIDALDGRQDLER